MMMRGDARSEDVRRAAEVIKRNAPRMRAAWMNAITPQRL